MARSNDRLVSLEGDQVRFRWKDYARGNRVKTMSLPAEELLRRFLLHVLPAAFVRIRPFGFLANRTATVKLARPAVTLVERCRALLAATPPTAPVAPESVATLLFRVTGVDITRCPVFRTGRLRPSTGLTAGFVAVFRPGHLPAPVLDTS